MKRNRYLENLQGSYLFPEINRRKREFLLKNPQAKIISLGIGDTTEPLPESVTSALVKASQKLGTQQGYTGYGPEQGIYELREIISARIYNSRIHADEVFVSDGAKCDIGRLQMLFGSEVSIAVQDPSYPVYVEGSLIQGVKNIHYMKCLPENQFFPDLNLLPKADLIYFCSPNNPTGAVANRTQLEKLVHFAKTHSAIIIFDSAYANFIQDKALPKSIYEIAGAKDVAIEISSFSKLAGFTGVRLGWTVIPKELKYEEGYSIRSDWNRLMTTLFNGASNISQMGGYAVLEEMGFYQISSITEKYMENARILKKTLLDLNYEVYGGDHAPYLWVRFPEKNSWAVFQEFLERYHIVITPGAGFGTCGTDFVRFSAFGRRDNILQAVDRMQKN